MHWKIEHGILASIAGENLRIVGKVSWSTGAKNPLKNLMLCKNLFSVEPTTGLPVWLQPSTLKLGPSEWAAQALAPQRQRQPWPNPEPLTRPGDSGCGGASESLGWWHSQPCDLASWAVDCESEKKSWTSGIYWRAWCLLKKFLLFKAAYLASAILAKDWEMRETQRPRGPVGPIGPRWYQSLSPSGLSTFA